MRSTILRYGTAFLNLVKKVDFWQAVKFSFRKVFLRNQPIQSLLAKPDPASFYSFICAVPFGEANNENSQVINWVVPNFGISSGGHLNIFRVIKKLEDMGHQCLINIDGDTHFTSGQQARDCIRENFFPINAAVSLGRDNLSAGIATFATSWTTAYTVRDFLGAGKRYYFVQDFEPYFTARGSDYIFAEETYRFGFKGITAGDWLAKKLKNEYGMEAEAFKFSYDSDLYKPHATDGIRKKRVFFYARPVTPRRAFELGILALEKVHELDSDIEFVLAGWDLSGYKIPFPYTNAGVLPVHELPGVYSQCDVALVLSFTNLSLLPLEVMACNCAVVSNRGDNVEWLLNEDVVKFAEPTPESLSKAVIELLHNPECLSELKESGLSFAASTSWDSQVEKIANILKEDLFQ